MPSSTRMDHEGLTSKQRVSRQAANCSCIASPCTHRGKQSQTPEQEDHGTVCCGAPGATTHGSYLSTPRRHLLHAHIHGCPSLWLCIQRGQPLSPCSARRPARWVPFPARSEPAAEPISPSRSPAAGTPLWHPRSPSCHRTPSPISHYETPRPSRCSDLGHPPAGLGRNWKQLSLQTGR